MITRIEAHSFKSMPSAHEENYDGWQLRLSSSRTKRINSVNFPGKPEGAINLDEKISFCEVYYNKHRHPCRFRITPLTDPASLENELSIRRYQPIDKTDILVQDLNPSRSIQQNTSVKFEKNLTQDWLNVICDLTERDKEEDKRSLLDTLNRIEIDTCYASILVDGKIAACGLATFNDGLMGLFEIATDPAHQRKGLGRQLIDQLLNEAVKRDIKTAYLQVVQSNETGRTFWTAMGFSQELYSYQYWVQPYDG
ncbi:MAG: GNAT family N-acetyltransferase [Sneathiella sp.]|nr:GNAT family N-acetyltransferase [Sneathiella sp.]